MTTAQSRQLTRQPSTSMIVAGQPNTFAGQIRDDETLNLTHGRRGNRPVDLGRVIDFQENSFHVPRNPQMIYGFSMAQGELGSGFTWPCMNEAENSWFRASLGEVQVEGFEDNAWVVGENFGRSHTDQMSWMGAHSFDDRVYQWRPSLSGELTSFEDSRRAFIEANRHPLSPRGEERARKFDPEVTRNLLRHSFGLFEVFLTRSGVYEQRIDTLRGFAADEEITVNETSVEDFRYFVSSVVPTQNAQLVVMDNGNLRAVWKNQEGSHIGLQFLGGHLVQYVVFRRGGPEGKVYRLVGESSFDEMRKLIEDWGLSSLMSA